MKTLSRFTLLTLVFLCVSCQLPKCPSCVPGEELAEAPPEVGADAYAKLDSVGQACSWLAHFKCPEAKPEGTTCEASTRTLVSLGTFEAKNVACLQQARSVEAIRKCQVDCVQ